MGRIGQPQGCAPPLYPTYSNYLVWMEMGRVEYCRAVGIRYRDMERDDGVLLIVAEAHCRYLAPAQYDDEVSVITCVEESRPRMVKFTYEMRRVGDDRLLVRGYTKHIFCDRNMRPTRLPDKYHSLFGID